MLQTAVAGSLPKPLAGPQSSGPRGRPRTNSSRAGRNRRDARNRSGVGSVGGLGTWNRDPSHRVAQNLLKQNFAADGPNRRWAGDITYIATHQGWLYLAVVMDLYSSRIWVGR